MSHESTDSQRASRKDEHLELAMRLHGQDRAGAFDDVSFIHHSLPGVSAEQVDIGTTVLGSRWEAPFYINAMTGGTQATAAINADLAEAAAEAGVAIACGSQHVALHDPERADGFHVIRRRAPGAFVLANVGPTVSPQEAARAVEMLEADALQIHLNAAQELVMPEGDRDFSGWEEAVATIVAAVPVPVVVKEVGFGLSRRSIESLARTGVAAVDVAGAGGTDFIAIENERRPQRDLSYMVGWGQPTALCLLESVAVDDPVGPAGTGLRRRAQPARRRPVSGPGSLRRRGLRARAAHPGQGGPRSPVPRTEHLGRPRAHTHDPAGSGRCGPAAPYRCGRDRTHRRTGASARRRPDPSGAPQR